MSWKFVVHVVAGVCLFGIIVVAAVQLTQLCVWMESQGVSPWAVRTTRLMEYLTFAGDAVLFTIFICRTTWVFGASMLRAEIAS